VEARLGPINAVLALAGHGGLPRGDALLARAGFRVTALEVPIIGAAGKVVIDVLLVQDDTGRLVAVECKSGGNIEDRQAFAYGALDPVAVAQAGYVTLAHRPSTEVLYVCPDEYHERIEAGLTAVGVDAAVLGVDAIGVRLRRESPGSLLPNAVGRGHQPVFRYGVPRIVPIDHDSPVDLIVPVVEAELVAHLAQRAPQVSIAALAERVSPVTALYARAAQQQLRKRVGAAAHKVSQRLPETYAFEPDTGKRDALVRFLRTPEDNDARGRTQAYQALRRGGRTRGRRHEENPDQMDLLRELGDADTVSADLDDGRDEGPDREEGVDVP
jgi:hypothetical protein